MKYFFSNAMLELFLLYVRQKSSKYLKFYLQYQKKTIRRQIEKYVTSKIIHF